MKIYTKTGDKGETTLIGGIRVSKTHPRIEAYGTVDELMAHIALLSDMLNDEQECFFLQWTLDRLMTIASILATEGSTAKKIPGIHDEDIAKMEAHIDNIDSNLPQLKSFILPGGHVSVSQCHVARTVCRRTERVIIRLTESYPVPVQVKEFMNRLSDYLFVLSRKILKDVNITPNSWIPVVD